MNKPLFEKIITAVKQEPRRFQMGGWLDFHSSDAPCGTTACIAGYAIILDQQSKLSQKLLKDPVKSWVAAARMVDNRKNLDFEKEARKLLGITLAQVECLFYTEGWPVRFSRKYLGAVTNEAVVEAVTARIRYFMKTGK